MKDRQNNDAATPEQAAIPFFARFLEGQHGGDAETQVAPSPMTLKYPSDRDEDNYFLVSAEAATTNAVPSRMTLKYPSDRDEIDNHVSH